MQDRHANKSSEHSVTDSFLVIRGNMNTKMNKSSCGSNGLLTCNSYHSPCWHDPVDTHARHSQRFVFHLLCYSFHRSPSVSHTFACFLEIVPFLEHGEGACWRLCFLFFFKETKQNFPLTKSCTGTPVVSHLSLPEFASRVQQKQDIPSCPGVGPRMCLCCCCF